jgi:Zn-dependent protease with chaperone function
MILSLAGSLLINVTLLLAVALLVDRLLRRKWVLALAAFWNAVLLAIIVLPLATLLVPRLTLPLLPAESQRESSGVDAAARSQSVVAVHGLVKSSGVQPQEPAIVTTDSANGETPLLVLAGIYALGMTTLLARLLAGWYAAERLRRHATPVTNSQSLERLDFWMARLGLLENQSAAWSGSSSRIGARPLSYRPRVRLLASDQIEVPVALGVRDPVILIPSSMIAKTTTQTVDAILVHELAHIYRADCGWQLLQRIVEAALWFHPLVWIAQRRIAFIRERACDDFAVCMVGDFRAYGETLLDIAAGMTRRRSLGLGLTMLRSSRLARRLAAIANSDGSSRCVAAPRARRLLTAGVVFSAVGLACVAFGRASGHETSAPLSTQTNPLSPKDAPSPRESSTSPATGTPELIAVTWQQIPESNGKRIEQPVWRPDGKRLTNAEAKALLDELKSFQTHWWNKVESLRPLVFVYRMPPAIQTGLSTAIVLPDGHRLWSGSWDFPRPNGLAKSACSPQRTELGGWPAKIDLDIKVPLENPQVIKTIKSIPEGAVEVDAGVRWYIDKERGADFSKRRAPRYGLTAAVLAVRNDNLGNLTKYDAKIWLRGNKEPLPVAYVTMIEPQPGVRTTIYVSRVIDDLQSIVRVEFTRQQFRLKRIEGVETHLDLMPAD